MLRSVKNAINKHNMFDESTTVTVALSGGADSVALLHALFTLKDELSINVEAAHLNHKIRGQDADDDEAFVVDFCKNLGVKLFVEHIDVPLVATNSKESLELAARNVRYEFLNSVSKGVIATAHTANDNIETLLFNMSRGAGLDGLCGIPPKRDNIIRPLIYVTRQEVENYCAQNNLKFCNDKTNADVSYARNRIRHNVVPELLMVNDNAVQNVSRLCSNISDDAKFLNSLTNEAFLKATVNGGLDVSCLLEQQLPIRRRMVAKLCELKTGLVPEEVHISAICSLCELNGNRVSFKGDYEATVRKGILRLEKKVIRHKNEAIKVEKFPFKVENIEISKLLLKNTDKFNSLLLKNALDYDKICGELILRHKVSGDKLKQVDRNVTKTLKKLFNESDMSAQQKSEVYVLADDNGVVWVENFGIDERVLVDEKTKCAIMINKILN